MNNNLILINKNLNQLDEIIIDNTMLRNEVYECTKVY